MCVLLTLLLASPRVSRPVLVCICICGLVYILIHVYIYIYPYIYMYVYVRVCVYISSQRFTGTSSSKDTGSQALAVARCIDKELGASCADSKDTDL